MLANSFLDGEDTVDLRNVFAMFESVGEHSKSQRLRFRDGFIARTAVREYPWKISHFADPATIVFAFDLDREVAHCANPTPLTQATKNLSAQRHTRSARGRFRVPKPLNMLATKTQARKGEPAQR